MAQAATPSVQMQTPAINQSSRSQIPFRNATIERVDLLAAETNVAMTTSTQRIIRSVEGTGYIYGIWLDVNATSATNTAASVPVYAEDGPFNALDQVVLADVNGEISSLQGYNQMLCTLIEGYSKAAPAIAQAPGTAKPASGTGGVGTTASQDANLLLNVGTVGTLSTTSSAGGNFRFQVRVSVATNRRDLLGILGNQDRAQRYSLRTDIAASTAVFGTVPSSLPNITINKAYEGYSIPLPTAPDGSPQQMFAPSFGTVHFHTQTVSEAAPTNGSTVNHYLRRIGNVVRWVGLVFRSATASSATPIRGNADANPPTLLRLKLGEDTVFNETWQYRRWVMFERYGFDMPAGVLVYDWVHDFGPFAGFELGDDYVFSQALVNSQFQIAYPSTGSTWQSGSTLTFVTSDMIFSEPQVASVR